MHDPIIPTRRLLLGGGASLVFAGGAWGLLSGCAPRPAPPSGEADRALMKVVADLVIPPTDTPGAGEAGAGDFVVLALEHGLAGSRQPLPEEQRLPLGVHVRGDGSLDRVSWLRAELDRRSGGDFMAEGVDRAAVLGALDAEAFGEGEAARPWRLVKELVLFGYYTSEPGASEELVYEPVPGRFDPDLPVTAETRTISNDWTAVEFG